MKKLANVHPGEILLIDYLEPMNITAYALAKAIDVDQTSLGLWKKEKLTLGPALYLFDTPLLRL